MTEIQAVCYVRDDRELHTLSDCEVLRTFPQLLSDIQRLAYGSGACEMVDRLTIDGEPAERLYRCLIGVLGGFEEVESAQIEPLFWYYQLRVADALGYRPELSCCVSCGAGLDADGGGEWYQFSPALGGAICAPCSRQATPCNEGGPSVPGYEELSPSIAGGGLSYASEGTAGQTYRVAGASVRFLAGLQQLRTYHREAIPPVPPRSGEIRGMLRRILEYHAGQSGRLRSLDFLDRVAAHG
jgi:recombinational DNA repair protein (RecF pathway)